MTFSGAHSRCTRCLMGPLKGVEKVVGICYNCNRIEYQEKQDVDVRPQFKFSDDDSSISPKPRDS
jgi:uncharacterized protein (DUF983 family)